MGIGATAIGYGLLALGLAQAKARRKLIGAGPLAAAAALALVAALTAVWLPRLPHVNVNAGFEVVDVRAGREGVLAVVEHPRGGRSLLVDNQYTLGSVGVRWDQERQTHIPLLLHPDPRKVAFIGLATGISPGAALDHSVPEQIDVIEISSLVPVAAGDYFDEFNNRLMSNDAVSVFVEDGRTFLASSPNAYDAVIGDLFLPWNPGVGRLFSEEHFRSVFRALKDGGLFCQWLPMFQLTEPQFEMIVRTFVEVFPSAHGFLGGFDAQRPVLALVGYKNGDLDWRAAQRRCQEERSFGKVGDPSVRHPEGLGMLYFGRWEAPEDRAVGAVNTLDNLRLELDASRERVTGSPGGKYFYGARWLAFVQARHPEILADNGLPQPLKQLTVHGANLIAVNRARAKSVVSVAEARAKARKQLSVRLLEDAESDWRRWPGLLPAGIGD